MDGDRLDALGPALAEVGASAVEIVGGNPERIFIYAEADEEFVGTSLFTDEGDHVNYVDIGDSDIWQLIMNARETEPDIDKRWATMEYEIKDGEFNATFKFSDEVDVHDDIDERRERILKARYGDKPVIYPPVPGDMFELGPDTQ